MKSPTDLSARLRKQWQDPDHRERRLLDPGAWPISLPIGKPTPTEFTTQGSFVREHVQLWRAIKIGEVQWKSITYRAGAEPVQVPTHWLLRTAAEWAAASGDAAIAHDQQELASLLAQVNPIFHRTLTRGLRGFANSKFDEVVQAADLVQQLEPGCAGGRPLRALALAGIDSKFFERHRALIQQLLDVRFDGQASEQGLESFLAALDEGDHWLLVAPLQPGLLSFARQAVPAAELMSAALPGTHVLIVENERSLHQLPQLDDTIAVLGSGLNLAWMQADWLRTKRIAYWGDLDTWGLAMLATARVHQPKLDALLMDWQTFDAHAALAVPEPHPASELPPDALSESERTLYLRLRHAKKGRLEQEFLRREMVVAHLSTWRLETAA
jgi:hypothetical protein